MPRAVPTGIEGLLLIEPDVHGDERGFFLETFSDGLWAALGVETAFVQHNHSRSRQGTLRGLHFQTDPGQAKLVRCARGEIFDVAVDLRRDSPTFREWRGFRLDDRDHRQLFVPAGFAHGFCVVSDEADVTYLVSSHFNPATEAGIRWDDPAIGVEWPVTDPLLSDRDREAPLLAEIEADLPFGRR